MHARQIPHAKKRTRQLCDFRKSGRLTAGRSRFRRDPPRASVHLTPITMDSGPSKCSTRASRNPASFIQPMQSAPV